jgi:Spy/CpxP family protein refolding chaperone
MKTQSVLLASAIAGLIGLASFSVSADDVVKNVEKSGSYHKSGYHKGHHKGGFKKVFAGLNLSDEQKTAMKNLREQKRAGTITREIFKSQMASILTPEQSAKITQMKTQRGEHKHRRGKGGFKKVLTKLNLSDEQKIAMNSLREQKRAGTITRETFKSEVAGILTPEQSAMMQQMKSKRGEHKHRGGKHGKMASLNLSDAQKTQMRELRKERRAQGRENFDRDSFMTKMRTILTPEQFAKFQGFKRR